MRVAPARSTMRLDASRQQLQRQAEAVIEKVLGQLPDPLRSAAEECVIEPLFLRDCLKEGEPLDEDLLGLFEGCSRADGLPESPMDLPRIRLFLDSLWDFASQDLAIYRQEVRITLLHELGHYLGLEEDEVAALGLS